MGSDKALANFTKKLIKTKNKLNKLKAKEDYLRSQIELILAKKNVTTLSLTDEIDNVKVTFTRKHNYSIPKVNVDNDIKRKLSDEQFNELFTTSYKLKPLHYTLLDDSAKAKKAIDRYLTIKDSPLQVRIKEVD